VFLFCGIRLVRRYVSVLRLPKSRLSVRVFASIASSPVQHMSDQHTLPTYRRSLGRSYTRRSNSQSLFDTDRLIDRYHRRHKARSILPHFRQGVSHGTVLNNQNDVGAALVVVVLVLRNELSCSFNLPVCWLKCSVEASPVSPENRFFNTLIRVWFASASDC